MDDAELRALEATIRRSLRRVPHTGEEEDLCQEALLRVLDARKRVAPEALDTYAWTVARNVALEDARRARSRKRAVRRTPVERAEVDPPDEVADVLSVGERRAVAEALSGLRPADRALLRDRYVEDREPAEVAERAGVTPRTLRVRLHRARARLLVQYVLLRRRLDAPAPCRRVLESIAARDRTTQQRLGADDHVARCELCPALVDEVAERRMPWLAAVPALGADAVSGAWRQSSRAAKVTAGAAGAALVAGGLVIASADDRPPPLQTTTAQVEAAPLRADDGTTLLPLPANVGAFVGEPVIAESVPVAAVVGDEAFWVGSDRARVLVVLAVTAESPVQVRRGQRVSFQAGTLAAHDSGFAATVGISEAEGASELDQAGVHVEVPPGGITIG